MPGRGAQRSGGTALRWAIHEIAAPWGQLSEGSSSQEWVDTLAQHHKEEEKHSILDMPFNNKQLNIGRRFHKITGHPSDNPMMKRLIIHH